MKNKGTILFFAIAFAIVSLFHISFTLVTYLVENKASSFANGDEKIEKHYLDSIAHKPVYNILIRKYTYAECKERTLNLGLDLKGGMNITLEVDLSDLVNKLSNNNQDPTYLKALNNARKELENSQTDFITLFKKAFLTLEPNGKLSAIFATMENKDEISLGSSNDEVETFLRNKAKSALGSTFEVLRKRIDKFGVTQPNIQKLEGSGRILIELPGVKDAERIRRLLQGSAKLEFWETYDNKEIIQYMVKANKILKEKLELDKNKKPTGKQDSLNNFFSAKKDSVKKATENPKIAAKKVTDNPKIDAKKGDKNSKSLIKKSTADTNGLLSKVDSTKKDSAKKGQMTAEEFNKENPLFKVLAPAIRNTEQGQYPLRGPVIGMAHILDTPTVNKYLAYPEVRAAFPADIKFSWTAKAIDKEGVVYQLLALKITTFNKQAPLDGRVITNARVDVSQLGEREVSLSMNAEGAHTWKQLTGRNLQKSIAIVLDGLVYSYPTVQSEIAGGNSQITGSFSNAEAQDLANILNSGKLDTKVQIIQEVIVGPSLGKESIMNGMFSILFGLLAVVLFMLFYYNRAGWVANLALFTDMFFIMGILSSLGAALTLPGIAGLVLTVGMSVDANVLIYERIREEIRNGKGIRLALRDGYKMALSSIIDSRLTTLIAGVVLLIFGSGPVYGFAIVLCIGILSSMFTSILISRIIFENLLAKDRHINFGNRITENLFKHTKIDFIGLRKYGYIVYVSIIIIGIVSFSTRGLEFGVDFKGGYQYVIRFDKNVNTNEITDLLRVPLQGAPEVKTFGKANQVKVTTSFLINSRSHNANDSIEKVITTALKTNYANFEILNKQKVGPTVADDIKMGSGLAVLFSLIGIFIYIFIRFKSWQFGFAGVLCLFIDVFIILTIFSLFRNILPFSLAIDQTIIAALLTVIGYDINDTVVVYDRIREEMTLIKRKTVFELINEAINITLSRTIISSFTVFIVLIVLFIFGGEIIRGFSFALLIGVIAGTASSIFIATPAVIELSRKRWAREQAALEQQPQAPKLQ